MSKNNPDNERLKRQYLIWMRQAHGRSETTVDAAAQALARFEQYTRHRAFKKFHIQQAVGFKAHLWSRRTLERASPSAWPLSVPSLPT